MLKCIECGHETQETFNVTQCACSITDLKSVTIPITTYYSTSIKKYPFSISPIERHNNILLLKREDFNKPSGTFKDRKATYVNYIHDKFAVASSGNQAIALAKVRGLQYDPTYVYVSCYVDNKKLEILRSYFSEITFTDQILSTYKLIRGEKDRWNITNGMDPIGASAYYNIAIELENLNLHNIVVPCGSGELFSALATYFFLLRKKACCPRIIGVRSPYPETDAISTEFFALQPFLDYFTEETSSYIYTLDNSTETLKNLYLHSANNQCELSSAVVFEAYKQLSLEKEGKTCLIVTGGIK